MWRIFIFITGNYIDKVLQLCCCLPYGSPQWTINKGGKKVDWEPPFSQIELLKFCDLNNWVFKFPHLEGWEPDWVGGAVWPVSRRRGWAVMATGGLSTRCYGPSRPLWWSNTIWREPGDTYGWGSVLLLGYSTLTNFHSSGGSWWSNTIKHGSCLALLI